MLGRRDEERHHLDLVIFVGAEEDLEIDQDGAESHRSDLMSPVPMHALW